MHTYRLGVLMGLGAVKPAPGFGVPDHTGCLFSPSNGLFNWDLNLQLTYVVCCLFRTMIAACL